MRRRGSIRANLGTASQSKIEDATEAAYCLLVEHSTSNRNDLSMYELKELLERDDFDTMKVEIQNKVADSSE